MDDKEEEEDERREAVIASTPSLQSDFKSNGIVTSSQLSKLQELHKRRLEIKSKWKFKKKQKDSSNKLDSKVSSNVDCNDKVLSSLSSDNNENKKMESSTQFVPTQRQKLFWGLDAKERWERKANM